MKKNHWHESNQTIAETHLDFVGSRTSHSTAASVHAGEQAIPGQKKDLAFSLEHEIDDPVLGWCHATLDQALDTRVSGFQPVYLGYPIWVVYAQDK